MPRKQSSVNQRLDANKVKAGATGAIGTIVKVLTVHTNNDDLCEWACAALWNMVSKNSKKKSNCLNVPTSKKKS